MAREIKPTVPVAGESLEKIPRLSGYNYVVMRPKEGDQTKKENARVKILTPRNCLHEVTVCPKCVGSWMQDYYVFFDKTRGGRNLAARTGEAQ